MQRFIREDFSPILNTPLFQAITTVADNAKMECYLIGGYVRDLLLKRPTNDIDIVVVGSGIKMAEAVAKQLGKGTSLCVFRNFGTAQVKWHGQEIEFVGARKESYHRESRNPIVEEGTLEDDLNRRDFTINALAICLNQKNKGILLDPFEGIADLKDHILRTPLDPDITFSDDPLRMMRCIRFATQLNFCIEDRTFDAIIRNKERIKIISQERITDELNKIMLSPTPSKGWNDLERSGLLAIIFPELQALNVVETRNGKSFKNNFYHTLEVLDNVSKKSDDLWMRWAAVFHDIGKPASRRWDPVIGWTFHNHNYIGQKMVPGIFRRMKLPMNDKMKFVQKMVSLHMRPIAIADDIVTDSAVRRLLFEAGDDIEKLMILCEADVTSKNHLKKKTFLNNFQLVRKKLIELEEKDRIRNFQPPVTGEEIMEVFNLRPSQIVGSLKSSIKDAILDGVIPNEHDAAFSFMLQRAKKMGLSPSKTSSNKQSS